VARWPTVASGRRFHGPAGVPRVGDGMSLSWSGRGSEGECGVERGGKFVRPWPRFGDFDLSFALAADDPGGGVQQPVAQGLGFGPGEVAAQAEQAEPAEQFGSDHRGDTPGGVDRHADRWEVLEAGVLAGADAVLDAGVGAVAGFEEVELPATGVLVASSW
jgi:hypothetical protein